jgi:hypothetical protein
VFVGALRCGRGRVRIVWIVYWVVWRVLAVDRSRYSLPRHLVPPVACASRLRPVPKARATMSCSPIRAARYRLLGPWRRGPCYCFDLWSLSFPLLLVYYCQVDVLVSGHRVTSVLAQSQIRRGEHPHSRATSRFGECEQEWSLRVVPLQRHLSCYAAQRRPRSPAHRPSARK